MTHKPSGTQQERIIKLLTAVRYRQHSIPAEYIKEHPSGDGISVRFVKRVMGISEANARVSELRSKGHDIEASKARDRYGFVYLRFKPEPSFEQSVCESITMFDALPECAQPHAA